MPNVGGISGELLCSLIERIEGLSDEKATLSADISEVFKEAKSFGLDTKIMRQIIKIRRMDKDDLDEQEALLDIYKRALGMLADTPLGEAALKMHKDIKAGKVDLKLGDDPWMSEQIAEADAKAAAQPNGGNDVAPAHQEARQVGRVDGAEGNFDHAARWPAGEYGHADYHIGRAQGVADRLNARGGPTVIKVEVEDMSEMPSDMPA